MKPSGKSFFVSEQCKPLHRSTVNLASRKYSEAAAALPFLAHPHMLRHACGFALADKARTPGSFRIISAIGTFSTASGTLQPIRRGLRSCGGKPTNGRGSMMAARRLTAFRKVMGAVPRPDEVAPAADSLPNGGSHIHGRAHRWLTCAARLPGRRKLRRQVAERVQQGEPQRLARLFGSYERLHGL